MNKTVRIDSVRKVVRVRASQERAFRVFTAGMGRWWRPDHHIAATPFADVVIEPRTGGRWYERDADGAECMWGKVLTWDPPGRVILAWQLDGNWQYDASFVTELEVRFIAEGSSETRVELEHRDIERFGDKAAAVRASFEAPDGWNGALVAYAAATEGAA